MRLIALFYDGQALWRWPRSRLLREKLLSCDGAWASLRPSQHREPLTFCRSGQPTIENYHREGCWLWVGDQQCRSELRCIRRPEWVAREYRSGARANGREINNFVCVVSQAVGDAKG